MKVVIGTKNKAKIAAVEEQFSDYPALANASISGVEVASGVSEQPLSLSETVQGAVNRARAAKNSDSDIDYGIGLESGLFEVPETLSGYLDICICAIVDDAHTYVGTSSGWEFPNPEVIKSMIESGLDMTQTSLKAGLTQDEELGQNQGAIGLVTNGRLDRKGYTKESIRNALIHLEAKHT